jgi:hypothetical protein
MGVLVFKLHVSGTGAPQVAKLKLSLDGFLWRLPYTHPVSRFLDQSESWRFSGSNSLGNPAEFSKTPGRKVLAVPDIILP